LRDKHVNSGIFINNSDLVKPEEAEYRRKTGIELKQAIEKIGPFWYSDPNGNYKYQWFKNIFEQKKKIISESTSA
jgi:hypothetical protein